ncbi:MAG TPA: endonuclease/exonuclease/phosphatase family protein [Kofleriaceae bacterium]
MKVLVLVGLIGCVDSSDPGGAWTDASAITGTFAPELGPAPAPGVAKCTLRIATWNLHTAPDPADLATQLLASREVASADVIFTQEIEAHPNEPGSRASRLATALGMTWAYAPARVEGNGTHGIAILSRYPLARVEVRELPFVDRPISTAHRVALAADVMIGDETLRVVDVHLDTRLSPADRIRQMHAAVNDVGEDLVVGGDLNSQPWPWIDGTVPVTSTDAVIGQNHARILDDYMAQNRFAGAISPSTGTMRIPVVSMRLDNLYARGYAITAADVEHVDGSDHWPVWIDLARCY